MNESEISRVEQKLVLYNRMCAAITEEFRIDEVKSIRDQAVALEVYARQAQNREAEEQWREIRYRAERKAGQLLAEMKRKGERADERGSNKGVVSSDTPTLKDLGITRDQSSTCQKMGEISDEDFEAALAKKEPLIKKMPPVITEEQLQQRQVLDAIKNATFSLDQVRRIRCFDSPNFRQ